MKYWDYTNKNELISQNEHNQQLLFLIKSINQLNGVSEENVTIITPMKYYKIFHSLVGFKIMDNTIDNISIKFNGLDSCFIGVQYLNHSNDIEILNFKK